MPTDRQDSSLKSNRAPRSACERCRAQKLRCQRSIPGQSQCDRCAKIGYSCSTFAMLPTGRPRLSKKGLFHERQGQRPVSSQPPGFRNLSMENTVEFRPDLSNNDTSDRTGLYERTEPVSWGLGVPLVDAIVMPQVGPHIDTSNLDFDGYNLAVQESPITSDNEFPIWSFGELEGADSFGDIIPTSEDSSKIETDKRQRNLDRLATLNQTLFTYITKSDNMTSYNSGSAGEGQRGLPSVGQLLRCTQEYAGILKHWMLTIPLISAPRLCTTNEDTDSEDDVSFGAPRSRSKSSCRGGNPAPNEESGSYCSSGVNHSPIDYPTMMMLSTAYGSLVRLHRIWLEGILVTLENALIRQNTYFKSKALPYMLDGYSTDFEILPDLPTVLPDLMLDGFKVSGHRTIQIKIVSEISLELLWRAERSLTSLAASHRGSKSALEGSCVGLLRTMLSQEVAESRRLPSASATTEYCGWRSLQHLAKQIRQKTRRNFCLQLEEAGLDAGVEIPDV